MGAGFSRALWLILKQSVSMWTLTFPVPVSAPWILHRHCQSLKTVGCLCSKEKVVGSTSVHVMEMSF